MLTAPPYIQIHSSDIEGIEAEIVAAAKCEMDGREIPGTDLDETWSVLPDEVTVDMTGCEIPHFFEGHCDRRQVRGEFERTDVKQVDGRDIVTFGIERLDW